MAKRVMLALRVMPVLGSQACEEKKLAEHEPGKALESIAAPQVTERREVGGENRTDRSSREGAPAGGSK